MTDFCTIKLRKVAQNVFARSACELFVPPPILKTLSPPIASYKELHDRWAVAIPNVNNPGISVTITTLPCGVCAV